MDAASIRAKMDELDEMAAYNFDLTASISAAKRKLRRRLADLGEGPD